MPGMVPQQTKIQTERILATIDEIRRALIPEQCRSKPRRAEETRMASRFTGDRGLDFELAAIRDAITAFRDELSETLEAIDAHLVPDFIDVYYTIEEMVQDPEHADLIPRLESLRKAYFRAYGTPIPPKPKTQA